MKSLGAGIAGWLVCLLVCTVAVAQSTPSSKGKSEQAAENSKPADKETGKPGQSTKEVRKGTTAKNGKGQPTKSTAKSNGTSSGDSDDTAADAAGKSAGSKSPEGGGAAKGKATEPNWMVEEISVAPHNDARYVRDAVTLAPTEGQTLVQGRFQITAIRPDTKAVDRYVRIWTSADRKDLARKAKAGARVLEARNIALMGPDGKRYPAIWCLEDGIRTRIVHVDIAPNRQSSRESSSGTTNPNSHWIDAEQSFMTRITRPFNQPEITEYSTVFTGILRTDEAASVAFLFSIPMSVDTASLRLVVDSEVFEIEE